MCATYKLKTDRGILDLSTPVVMGIVNLTPDSFHHASRAKSELDALHLCETHLKAGANLLDVGAESTRPKATNIGGEEERRRLLPVVEQMRKEFPEAILSVDTYRSTTASEALHRGVDIINDISGGDYDERMFETVAKADVPYVLMHVQGTPENMQVAPQYDDVVQELKAHFEERIERLHRLGHSQIIIDPGFGFGKTLEHNFQIMASLQEFNDLECPLLVGVSRKSMINKLLNVKASEALNGTTALHMMAMERGARILRVHDVQAAVEAVNIFNEVNKYAT